MKTIIIYDEEMQLPDLKAQDTILFPIPNFAKVEVTATNDALKIARVMRAEKIVIYRDTK